MSFEPISQTKGPEPGSINWSLGGQDVVSVAEQAEMAKMAVDKSMVFIGVTS